MKLLEVKKFDDSLMVGGFKLDPLFPGASKVYPNQTDETFQFDEKKNEWTLHIELAGMEEESLKELQVEDGCIVVKAEIEVGSYQKKVEKIFVLPKKADQDNIVANLKNGLLTFTVPKEETNRKILLKKI